MRLARVGGELRGVYVVQSWPDRWRQLAQSQRAMSDRLGGLGRVWCAAPQRQEMVMVFGSVVIFSVWFVRGREGRACRMPIGGKMSAAF